jgi:hypothetical protein
MNLHFLKPLLWLVLLSFSANIYGELHAQSPVVNNIRFRVLTWSYQEPSGVSYLSNGKLVDIIGLSGTVRSAMKEYTGPSTLIFYPDAASRPKLTVPTAELPEAIANVEIPAGIKAALIILFKNPSGAPLYRALVLDDSTEAFPFGSYLVINYSTQRVATSMADKQFILEPKQQEVITLDREYFNIRVAVSRDDGARWKIVYKNYFPNHGDQRTLFFMLDVLGEDRKSISIRPLLENQAVWDAAQKPKAPAKTP